MDFGDLLQDAKVQNGWQQSSSSFATPGGGATPAAAPTQPPPPVWPTEPTPPSPSMHSTAPPTAPSSSSSEPAQRAEPGGSAQAGSAPMRVVPREEYEAIMRATVVRAPCPSPRPPDFRPRQPCLHTPTRRGTRLRPPASPRGMPPPRVHVHAAHVRVRVDRTFHSTRVARGAAFASHAWAYASTPRGVSHPAPPPRFRTPSSSR